MIHSGDISLVLLCLKYPVVSFRTQNKTVLLSTAPPVRKTSPFYNRSRSPRLVLIVCCQFVNYAILLLLIRCFMYVSKEARIRNRYNQVPRTVHLTGKRHNTTKHYTHVSQ